MKFTFSKPEVAYDRRLIHPRIARRLGNKMLRLPQFTSTLNNRFNVSLAMARIDEGQTASSAMLEEIANSPVFDDETKTLLGHVGHKALSKMSGLRRGGLPSYMQPVYVGFDVNVYEPFETFATHMDGGMSNDVAAVTLLGEGAQFMHVKRNTQIGNMPDSSQVQKTWIRYPGDAVFIRNHLTARENTGGKPLHAVKNWAEQRVTLQVQVSYG